MRLHGLRWMRSVSAAAEPASFPALAASAPTGSAAVPADCPAPSLPSTRAPATAGTAGRALSAAGTAALPTSMAALFASIPAAPISTTVSSSAAA